MSRIKVHVAMIREGVFAFTVTAPNAAGGRQRFERFDAAIAYARTLGADDDIDYGANDIWVPLTATPGIEGSFDDEEV